MGYNILPDYLSRGEVEFLSGVGWGGWWWWWWWCKVIIVSNPTAVEVVLSCIEVVVGVLTKIIFSSLKIVPTFAPVTPT